VSEYGPVGHQIEIEVPGSGTWWGYTNAAPPKEMCCIDQLRTVSGPALLGAAFHEAGHAVVALHAGMPPVDLDVSPGAVCPRCGAQQAHGVNHGVSFSAAPPDDVLMVLAAGVQADLAQARICGPVSPAEQWAIEVGGLDDQHLARELVDLLPDDNRLDYGPVGTRARPQRGAPAVAADRGRGPPSPGRPPCSRRRPARTRPRLRIQPTDMPDSTDRKPVMSIGKTPAELANQPTEPVR